MRNIQKAAVDWSFQDSQRYSAGSGRCVCLICLVIVSHSAHWHQKTCKLLVKL